MNDRLRLLSALLLVAAGLICIVFAVAQWPSAEQSAAELQNETNRRDLNGNSNPLHDSSANEAPGATAPAEDAPVAPEPGTPPATEEVPAAEEPMDGDSAAVAVPPSSDAAPPAAAVSPRSARMPQARKDALMLWVLTGLPMVFVVLVVIILTLRWLRPRPMARTGPSDTTDLWQEAGKRFRLQ